MTITCPKCHNEMVVKIVNDTEIDYCENGCKGVWFDRGEIKKIREELKVNKEFKAMIGQYKKKLPQEIKKEASLMCPHCNEKLSKVNKPKDTDIYVDICQKCKGFWLDNGELNTLMHYFNTHKNADYDFAEFVFDVFIFELFCTIVEGVIDGAIDSI